MTTSAPPLAPADLATEVLSSLEGAWNDADGAAFGAAYAEDATFVTVRGERVIGRAAISAGHAQIFGSIYAGSTNQMVLQDAREVADGVVVAVSRHTLDCPTGPLAGVHLATSTSVIARRPGTTDGWQVVATHNTRAEM